MRTLPIYRVGVYVILLMFLLVSGGCSYKKVVDFILPPPKEAAQDNNKSIEILPEGNTGVDGKKLGSSEDKPAQDSTYPLTLYFGDKAGSRLVAEEREVTKAPGMARKAIQELIKGPQKSGHVRTMPKGTKLLDINLKPDGLCIVDFSKEIVNNHSGGTSGETQTLASIINTLTQFPTIQKVQILVEGEKVETLAGHIDISKPLTREAVKINQN